MAVATVVVYTMSVQNQPQWRRSAAMAAVGPLCHTQSHRAATVSASNEEQTKLRKIGRAKKRHLKIVFLHFFSTFSSLHFLVVGFAVGIASI